MTISLPTSRQATTIALALAVSATLIACGGGSELPSSTTATTNSAPPSDLTKYLPKSSAFIATADLKAVREQLDLPADTDALKFAGGTDKLQANDPVGQLTLAAGAGFGPLEDTLVTFKTNAVVDALDGSKIELAATNVNDAQSPAAAIKTSQSFDEIAKSLESSGFTRDGDTLTAKGNDEPYTSVAETGSGDIVFAGGNADAAELAKSPPGGPSSLVDLIAPATSPVAGALTQPANPCVTAFGGWTDPAGNGTIRLTVKGEADPDALDVGVIETPDLKFSEPEIDGDAIEIPYTNLNRNPQLRSSPLAPISFSLSKENLYDCG
jgi:hypothetical protein